jgi:palmitoyl transferase
MNTASAAVLTISLVVGGAMNAHGADLADASAPAVTPSDSVIVKHSSMWMQAQEAAAATMQSNRYEVYLPLHTWHNRKMYTAEKVASFNEDPWGLGVGKFRFDERGNWHAWYVMAFLDSHKYVEPIAGYAYEKLWHPANDWHVGLGFTAGLTSRQDYNFVPLPLVLPLVSIGYRRATLQATYIPGTKGAGNILFTWMRWQF